MSETRDDFVVSFRPHGGYDAPLLAIKGATAPEMDDKIRSAEATGLFATIGNADQAFKAAFNLGAGLGATPVAHPDSQPQGQGQSQQYNRPAQQAQQQRQAPEPPPGVGAAPMCPHGQKVYKTGTGRKGKWEAWMCQAPRNAPDKCDPEWI